MEKNGNTFAPGDRVRTTNQQGSKVASAEGEVKTVDTETEQVLVKVGGVERWLPFNQLEKA